MRRLLAGLARVTGKHGVPLTVMLIPSYDQIMGEAGFGFQDTLIAEMKTLGINVLDPREAFLSYPDKPRLFLPDKHFTPAGNQVMLQALAKYR